MTLEKQINNVKALIEYRNSATDPIEGVKILLKCAQEFNEIDLMPLINELYEKGPKQFINDNLPDPYGIEEYLTEPFSFTRVLKNQEALRDKYKTIHNRLKQDRGIDKAPSLQNTYRLSNPEDEITHLVYLYTKLVDFWNYDTDENTRIEAPTKGVMEECLADQCGIEYKTLTNSGIVLSVFQELLKCKSRDEQLGVIQRKSNTPDKDKHPRKESCLTFIIGLGDWGNEVNIGLNKFGYSLLDNLDHELAIKYLLTQPPLESGRKNLEWINTVLQKVLTPENYQKHHFAMPGERAQKKQSEQTKSAKSK